MATVYPRNINLDVDPTEYFEPGMFSIPELQFLGDNLKKPPIAAFYEFDPDGKHKGVIRQRAETMLSIFYEHEELRKHQGVEWVGYEAIADSIQRFLQWHYRCQEIRRRGGPPNPSMFHWDDTGKAHKYAIGADSAEMVRTEILDDGSRQAFRVQLALKAEDALRDSLADVAPWMKGKPDVLKNDKLEISSKGRSGYIRCPICEFTQNFQTASSASRTAAMGRIARHLKSATEEVNRHRLLYTKEFKK